MTCETESGSTTTKDHHCAPYDVENEQVINTGNKNRRVTSSHI